MGIYEAYILIISRQVFILKHHQFMLQRRIPSLRALCKCAEKSMALSLSV
jgi:hypothetical protein